MTSEGQQTITGWMKTSCFNLIQVRGLAKNSKLMLALVSGSYPGDVRSCSIYQNIGRDKRVYTAAMRQATITRNGTRCIPHFNPCTLFKNISLYPTGTRIYSFGTRIRFVYRGNGGVGEKNRFVYENKDIFTASYNYYPLALPFLGFHQKSNLVKEIYAVQKEVAEEEPATQDLDSLQPFGME